MDRRGLLKLFAGSAAAPLFGAKAAANALGVSLATNAAPIVEELGVATGAAQCTGMGNPHAQYYGSPVQMAFDARRAARYEAGQNIGRYAHFKSWGPAFRESVIAREELAIEILRRKMEVEDGFAEKVFTALGVLK